MSTLTGRLTNLPTLALQEREKVDVDFVLVRAREPVRCTGIDLEAGFLTIFAEVRPAAPIGTIWPCETFMLG